METALCKLFKHYGSDKVVDGRKDRVCHNYSPFYFQLFNVIREQRLNLLEVGIGRSPLGIPGPSLKAWRDFFESSMIFGADIKPKLMFEEPRIRTHVCDHMDGHSLEQLKQSVPEMDIIIEDGLHTLEGNLIVLAHLWPILRNGGIYVIEDVKPSSIETLKVFCRSFGKTEVKEFGGKYDDTVIVIWKK